MPHIACLLLYAPQIDEPTVGNMKKSLSSFFGQVSDALIPALDDEQDQAEVVLITNDGQVTLTGFQRHLAGLQSEDNTYLTEPSDRLAENYQRWLEVTEQDQFTQSRLAKHLTSSEILNEKYLALVPERVTHMDFWQRYLFRRALLEDALANAELAERRARAEQAATEQRNAATTAAPAAAAAKRLVQTEQPKTVLSVLGEDESDVQEGVEEACAVVESVTATAPDEADQLEAALTGRRKRSSVDESNVVERWTEETDFASMHISEEEQHCLLLAYEKEMQQREKKRIQYMPLEEKVLQSD